ncbi:MAG: hypothetical protein H6664_03605 [Ardenticatenaceae bacterium]|nr:hypothetical protein [Ardenticatenaceae bacterium]
MAVIHTAVLLIGSVSVLMAGIIVHPPFQTTCKRAARTLAHFLFMHISIIITPMTTYNQFCAGAKTRHDYSDMIQVRYPHPNGEAFDTWVSGEEVMARLNTAVRERLIKSFSTKNWQQAKDALGEEVEKGKQQVRRSLKDRLSGAVSDAVGGNIFGDTLADNLRGVDSNQNPREQEKLLWQNRLTDSDFRAVVLELAWINLRGTMPDEALPSEPDDWI